MTSTGYGRSLFCQRFCPFAVSPLRHRKPLPERLPLLNGGRHDAFAERLQQSRWSSICIHAYQNPYQPSPGPDRAFSIKISLAKVSGRLDLSWMGLEALDPQIFQLTELKELTVAGNRLTHLPEELGQLNQLRNFQAAGNLLEKLPNSFTQLTNLEGLWLHGNVLKELPEDFGNLKQLETISLAGNQIERLPASLAELKQLKDLSLSGNLLKELPSAIGELGSLTTLSLNGNQLTSLPSELADCESLQNLHLQYNSLQTIPEELSKLKKLKELNLSDNRLNALPQSWVGLRSCESVWLYGNLLESLPEDFFASENLDCCWMENNPLNEACVSHLLDSTSTAPKLRELGLDTDQVGKVDAEVLAKKVFIKTGQVPHDQRGYFKLRHAATEQFNEQNAAKVLVVTFASAPGTPNWGGLLGKYVAQASPDESRFDILYVCDGGRGWYQAGDEGFAFWEGQIAKIRAKYERVIMLGDSMGATAALLFSHLATTVQAFTPQVDLANASIRPGQSQEWLTQGKLRILESINSSSAEIKVHTGTWDHDLEQAKLLPSDKCELVIHHLDSHRLAIALHREGQLLPIIRRSILSELGLYTAPRLVNLL